ncbi:MAG: hypothetical protein KJ067_25845 [Vicinamibacteria bacterium]|nr:hypothetical protein [Vicinamibacteria bacterium]
MTPAPNGNRRPVPALQLATVFALALVLRLGFFVLAAEGPLSNPDTAGYEELARALHQGQGYRGGDQAIPGRFPTDLLRPPGYPLFLAMVSAGRPEWRPRVAVAQCALGALTAVVAAVFAAWITGVPRAGFVAGLLQALDWTSIVHASVTIAEIPFTLLLTVGVAAWFRGGWAMAAMAGLLLGSAALVKPIGQVVPVALVVAAGLARARPGPTVALVTLFLLTTTPWALRNDRVHGLLTLSPVAMVNLSYHTAVTLADRDARRAAYREFRSMDGTAADRWSDLARSNVERLRAAWPTYLREAAVGWARTALGTATATAEGLVGRGRLPAWIQTGLPILHLVIVWSLCLVVFFVRRGSAGGDGAVALWLLVLALILPAMQAGYSRFRVPAAPFICTLAAMALASGLGGPHGPREPAARVSASPAPRA